MHKNKKQETLPTNKEKSFTEDRSKKSQFLISNKSYSALIENLEGYAIFTVDKKGFIFIWNKEAKKIFGYTRKEIIGKDISIILPKEGKILKRQQSVLSEDYGKSKNKRVYKRKDGSLLLAEERIFPLEDEKGNIRGYTKILFDLTESRISKKIDEDKIKLASIIESSDDAIFTKTMEGFVTSWNKGAEKLYGYKKEEIIGKNVSILMPNDHKDDFPLIMNQLKKGKRVYHYETVRQKKNGDLVDISVSVSPTKDADGNIIGASSIGRDITRQKHLLKMQQKEKERLFSLFMQAPVAIAILQGPDHIIELANPITCKMWNKRYEDIVGKSLLEVFPQTKDLELVKLLDYVLKTGKTYVGKEREIKSTLGGITSYFNFIYEPMKDIEGDITAVIVIANEVSEQVKTLERIQESERKFHALADNIPNFVWMARPDGWVYWYNNRWYEYTGTTREEMEGIGWQKVQDPKILPLVLKKWKESLSNGQKFEMVLPLQGADGIFSSFLTRFIPILDNKGRITQWFGTGTDISKQIEIEKQKDEFLGVVSHELKTPVTSIKVYTQVLHRRFKKSGEEEAAGLLLRMDTQINKLTDLINDLLDVTRIEAGKLKLNEEEFEFDTLVIEVIEEVQRVTERHNIKKLGNTGKKIVADRERITQVIVNLLSNAIKYSPFSQDIIVKSSLEGNSITLCVQDFGVGIPKEKMGRIFERFYRVNGPKENTFSGIGLGLYISSKIIRIQGGEIWVESKEGEGSKFYFSLPLNRRKMRKVL